ncbi:MAG TPA: hypothetical protein VL426_00620, partial [Candidatus Binatia bacterium]|nr:hypothetical protein [Candidatus Binatia bacterium]
GGPMSPTPRRRLRRAAKAVLLILTVSFVWAMARLYWPPERFTGSPPRRYAERRNALRLDHHGEWLSRFGKTFRPSGFSDLFGPALFASPIVHYFAGWDVYEPHVCVEGRIKSLSVAQDDGDIGMHLALVPRDARYAWRRGEPDDARLGRNDLVVEIDENIREFFPIVPELAVGDRVLVCGRWVYDRGHDHNEIHPARWIQFIDE